MNNSKTDISISNSSDVSGPYVLIFDGSSGTNEISSRRSISGSNNKDSLVNSNSNANIPVDVEAALSPAKGSVPNRYFRGLPLFTSSSLANILWMGFCFWLILVSFLAVQNLQSQLNASLGFTGLGILYSFLSFSSLTSVPIVDKLDERIIFSVASISYALFIAANISVIPSFFYFTCLLNGTAAAVFWVAQGIYLNRVTTDSNRQRLTSIFVAFLAASHLFGNGLTAILQQFPNFSFETLFIICSLIPMVASICLLLLRPAGNKPVANLNLFTSVLSSLRIFLDPDLALVWPIIAAYGFNLSYVFGSFPAHIGDTHQSSIALTCFGMGHVLVSISGGAVAHWLGGNFLFCLSTFGMISGIILASVATSSTWWIYLLAGLFLGFMEPGFLIQIFLLFGKEFPEKLSSVNSAFRFLSGGSMAFIFFISITLPYSVLATMVAVIQFIAFILIMYRSYRKKPHYAYLVNDN